MTEFSTTGFVGAGAGEAGVPVSGDAGAASARRRFSGAEKARIVAESERPGTTIMEVARRHGIDESTLRGWRRRVLGSVDGTVSGRGRRWTEAEKARAVAKTLRRWRRWWREAFPSTREWRARRGELAAPPGEAPLRWLLRSMRGGGFRSQLLRSLVWLMPWTGYCALGAGPASPAESVSVMNG